MVQSLTGVLLVEDDEGDAVLVQECLREAGLTEEQILWRRTAQEGIAALDEGPSCVLLDLGLPDAHGLEAIHTMMRHGNGVPVIVLTGRHDRIGTEAVAAGAQDYLVKDDISPELLDRAIRYAVERRQAQQTELQLREERLLAAENSRLERGLLPRPLLRTRLLSCASHYRPGRASAVLGGDFFDVVEPTEGCVRAVIGDVMGHGPDEAALGVHLRVAWRALVLAGVPDDEVLGALARLLQAEGGDEIYATVCEVSLDRERGLSVRVAGHPPPLMCTRGAATYVDHHVGPPLGLRDVSVDPVWPLTRVAFDPGSTLLLYTDGLLDAYRIEADGSSVGLDELLAQTNASLGHGHDAEELVSALVSHAPARSEDDMALVALTREGR